MNNYKRGQKVKVTLEGEITSIWGKWATVRYAKEITSVQVNTSHDNVTVEILEGPKPEYWPMQEGDVWQDDRGITYSCDDDFAFSSTGEHDFCIDARPSEEKEIDEFLAANPCLVYRHGWTLPIDGATTS